MRHASPDATCSTRAVAARSWASYSLNALTVRRTCTRRWWRARCSNPGRLPAAATQPPANSCESSPSTPTATTSQPADHLAHPQNETTGPSNSEVRKSSMS